MPNTIKRHFLKEKETEQLLRALSQRLHIETHKLLGSKRHIELAETESTEIYILHGKPILTRLEGGISPTLRFEEIFRLLPEILVDRGAIPFICNGADVMAPGIVRIRGDFNENDILLIADEKHEKPVALGIALYNSERTRKLKHGKAAKNIHFIGDHLWNLLKKLRQESPKNKP